MNINVLKISKNYINVIKTITAYVMVIQMKIYN